MPAPPPVRDDPDHATDGDHGFSLRFSRDDHQIVVEVAGTLDASSAPLMLDPMLDVIEAQGNHSIAIDLGGVDFMDSSGLRAVVSVHRLLQTRGGTLVLRHPTSTVRRMLELTGMYDVLTVAPR